MSFCSHLYISVQNSVKHIEVYLIYYFIPKDTLNNCLLKSTVISNDVKSIHRLLMEHIYSNYGRFSNDENMTYIQKFKQ